MRKIDKHFVSEIDKKMTEFDATHAKSPAQQAEFDKYQEIDRKRDGVIGSHLIEKIWKFL